MPQIMPPDAFGADSAKPKTEVKYRELLEQLPVGIYRTTADGRIIECNSPLVELLGYSDTEELLKVNVADLYVNPEDRSDHLDKLARNELQTGEFELRRLDGKTIWVHDYPRALRDETGAIVYIDGIIVDVTSQKETEVALGQSELDYHKLFESARDAMVVFTVDKEIILDLNPRACELYGFERSELLGTSFENLTKDVKTGKSLIKKTLDENTSQRFETVHYRKDGSEMLLEVNAALIEHNGRQAIVSIQRDITERKRMEQAIRDMAFHDPLTGLPNRKMFFDRLALFLAQVRRSRRRLCVLFIDLDRFKGINDQYGHAVGDTLLCGVARRLERVLREGDTVARIGGDEFTVLIPEISRKNAARLIAAKIIEEIEKPIELANHTEKIGASVGIAYFPDQGDSPELLVQKADEAMYKAKVAGKGQFREYEGDSAEA